MTPDLSVSIGAWRLTNPLIAASGCFGYGVEYADAVDLASLGGVAVKGLFLKEREGHPPPRIVETPSGMLNAIAQEAFATNRIYGLGSAMAVLTFIIVMIVSFSYIRFVGGNLRGLAEE